MVRWRISAERFLTCGYGWATRTGREEHSGRRHTGTDERLSIKHARRDSEWMGPYRTGTSRADIRSETDTCRHVK